MSILSISVLAFVFVISIWALFPGLVIKYVNTKGGLKSEVQHLVKQVR